MKTYTTTSIKATSRASVKVGDKYYTVEMCEERALNTELDEKQVQDERNALWDTVNEECDKQIAEIIKIYSNKN